MAIVDCRTGKSPGALEFTAGCREVFDVGGCPEFRRPMLLNPEHPAQAKAVVTPAFSGWIQQVDEAKGAGRE